MEDSKEITDRKKHEDKMDFALKAIAGEIKRLSSELEVSPNVLSSKKMFDNGIINKSRRPSKHKTRKQHIARLRKDLRAACSVVKILEFSKRKEVNILKGLLSYARNECVDLLQRYNSSISKSISLYNKKEVLNKSLVNLNSAIELGYEKLKKIAIVATEDNEPSIIEKLEKLVECCGQVHVDCCNESAISAKAQQRNRFFKNKILILEINIGALKQQLKALEYQNLRLKTENDQLRAEIKCPPINNEVPTLIIKDNNLSKDNNKHKKKIYNSGDFLQQNETVLNTHMLIVKSLLSDQDNLLRDLCKITEELSPI